LHSIATSPCFSINSIQLNSAHVSKLIMSVGIRTSRPCHCDLGPHCWEKRKPAPASFPECLAIFNSDRVAHRACQFWTQGEDCIQFYQDANVEASQVAIYYVFVAKARQGVFTAFLKQLVADEDNVQSIVIVAVCSTEMESCLNKFGREHPGDDFVCHGGDWLWQRGSKIRCSGCKGCNGSPLPYSSFCDSCLSDLGL
jgi:hypothetical protein